MESRRIFIYVYAIKVAFITIVLCTDVLVRSICFEDILSFHSNNTACAFNKNDFNLHVLNISNSKKCQIDCSVISTHPNLSFMNEKQYEIAKIEFYIVSTSYKFVRDKACGGYNNTHFNITIGCAGEYFYGRKIGESCVSDQQYVSVNSTCNETSGMCQCNKGHLYLWEADTCGPELGLNKSYDNAIQCSMATPNATCNDTTGVFTCAEGHMMVVDTCVNDTYGNYNSDVIISSGVVGLVLGIAICGTINFTIHQLRNQSGLRSYILNGKISGTDVQVCQSMNSNPICNHKSNDEDEGDDIYNHLHEDPVELSVQTNYDVPQHVTGEDDYSHLTTFNTKHIKISGDYGVIS